jgi:iron complex outermembrane receptor protein
LKTLRTTIHYGKHYDERGTIGAAVQPSAEIGSTVYLDLELGYQMTENLRIALGGANVLDEFVDEIGDANANRLSVGLQYPRRSAANYEGGSWYLRGIWSW